MTDAHWDKINRTLGCKARADSLNLGDPTTWMPLIRANWELLVVEADLDIYLDAQELAEMQTAATAQQAALDDLNAEIASRGA